MWRPSSRRNKLGPCRRIQHGGRYREGVRERGEREGGGSEEERECV